MARVDADCGSRVFRRIGGLEIQLRYTIKNSPVFRRIGGLENDTVSEYAEYHVFRRIGGLENLRIPTVQS